MQMFAAKQLKHFSSTSQKEINMYDIKQPSSISQAPLMQKYTCLLSKLCQTTLKHLSSTSCRNTHVCYQTNAKQLSSISQAPLIQKYTCMLSNNCQTILQAYLKHISCRNTHVWHKCQTTLKHLSSTSQAHKKTTMLESNPGAFGGSSMSPASCRCGIEK